MTFEDSSSEEKDMQDPLSEVQSGDEAPPEDIVISKKSAKAVRRRPRAARGRPRKGSSRDLQRDSVKYVRDTRIADAAATGTPVRRTMPLMLGKDANRKFRCEKCRAIIQGDQQLLRHWNTKHVTENFKDCVRDDPRAVVLDDEAALAVMKEKRKTYQVKGGWMCPLCCKVMRDVGRLGTHMYRHMEHQPLSYRCHLCPKDSQYACPEPSMLTAHFRRRHGGVKPYSCKSCSKSFKLASQLQKHAMEHQNVLHQCDVCGRQFAVEGSLKWHLSNAHADVLRE